LIIFDSLFIFQNILKREEKNAILKAKLEEMQNSIGKNEKQLTARITELQDVKI
jgi:hypothetical protein